MVVYKGDTVSDLAVVGRRLLARGDSHNRLSGRALGVHRALQDKGNLQKVSRRSDSQEALAERTTSHEGYTNEVIKPGNTQ